MVKASDLVGSKRNPLLTLRQGFGRLSRTLRAWIRIVSGRMGWSPGNTGNFKAHRNGLLITKPLNAQVFQFGIHRFDQRYLL